MGVKSNKDPVLSVVSEQELMCTLNIRFIFLGSSTEGYLLCFPDRRFLTGQGQITRWVTLCFGQAAVFTAAVLQDVPSRMHPVLWITQDSNNVKHVTNCPYAESQVNKLTVVWRKRFHYVLGRCALRGNGAKKFSLQKTRSSNVGWWGEELTSVGAGLLERSVCGCASDISDNFSSSSSWMGEDGDLRVLEGKTQKIQAEPSIRLIASMSMQMTSAYPLQRNLILQLRYESSFLWKDSPSVVDYSFYVHQNRI